MYKEANELFASLGVRDALIIIGTSCNVFPIDRYLSNGNVYKVFSAMEFPKHLEEILFDKIYLGSCTEIFSDIKMAVEERNRKVVNIPSVAPMKKKRRPLLR